MKSNCITRKRPTEIDGYALLRWDDLEIEYYDRERTVYFTLNDLAPYSCTEAFTQSMQIDLEMDTLDVLLKVYKNRFARHADIVSYWCIL